MGKRIKLDNNKQYDVYEEIVKGVSYKTISKKYGISLSTVSLIKKRKGRKLKISNKKYYSNENYFENIDNEEKAYWLGFLYFLYTNSNVYLERKHNIFKKIIEQKW